MSIKLTSAETSRNRSSLAAAVGSSDKIDIASFTATYIKDTPTGWSNISGGTFDTENAHAIGAAVQINNIYVTDSSWNNLDDTAISTSGGYLKIVGVGFQSGCVVYIQGVAALSVTFYSVNELRVVTPTISSGTLQVYVVNPDNSIAIRLSGIVASGVPNWVTTSPLNNQLTDTAFSIQLSAVSDSTVAYSLQSGSSLPSGTSLSSSGLLSGTVSGIATETTYSFTIVATDLELQDTSKLFSVTITAGDSYFYLTPLLTNGRANTWVSDASSNNTQILTIGNDTRPSAFSPYNTQWSAYGDGTSDYLSIANTSILNFGTGPYTVEFWYWGDPAPLVYQAVVSTGSGGFRIFVGYTSGFSLWTGATPLIQTGSVLLKNAWNFCQVIRSNTATNGTTLTVNGVNYPGTDSTNWTGAAFTAGWESGQGAINGYISNLRISNIARSNTRPTSAFTDDANTKFLTFQSNYFRDNSTANSGSGFAVTKFGEIATKNFTPFVETDLINGSAYFDGTGDYLVYADNPNLELGSGDFCFELWVYATSVAGTGVIIDKRSGSYGPLLIWRSLTALTFYMSSTGGSWDILNGVSPGNIENFNWYHIAVYRSSGVVYTAINGKIGTTTNSNATPVNNAGNWYIGTETNGSTNPWTGYMSNLRFTVGSSPYGSSNFTPSTSPLTASTNTRLLSLQYRKGDNNHRFIDEAGPKNITSRAGNASQGSFSPFSPVGWSGYFDGTGDYLNVTGSSSLAFDTNNFTIELFAYFISVAAEETLYDGRAASTGTGPQPCIILNGTSTGKLTYYVSGATRISSNSALTAGQWYHIVISRVSSVTRMFINGTQQTETWNDTTTYTNPANRPVIGAYADTLTSGYMNGYISNVRVLNGTGVTSVTVPTSNLTAVANTVLLTCQDNRFKDNSTANSGSGFTITKAADAKVQPFSPFRGSGEYSPTTHGGSMYIDGTGDYLIYNSPPNMTIGTKDFSIEFWVYGMASGAAWWCFDCRPGGDGAYPLVYWDGTSFTYYVNTGARITSTPINIYGQWAHVVVSRVSAQTRMWVNGVQQSTVYSDTVDFANPGTSRPWIGLNGLNGLSPSTGYLSGLKVTVGSGVTSVTVPTAPPTVDANTVIFNTFTNAGIVDATARNVIETVGDARISNTQSKFGIGSISFPGSLASYLKIPTNPSLDFGTGDFTAETWVYFNTVASDQGLFGGSTTNAWEIRWRTSTGLNLGRLNTAFDSTWAWSPSSNTWYHVAVTRSGANTRAFINGTQIGSTLTNANTYNSGTLFYAGLTDTSNNPLNGYMDEIRVTKGVARYTSNFTAPTAPFLTR